MLLLVATSVVPAFATIPYILQYSALPGGNSVNGNAIYNTGYGQTPIPFRANDAAGAVVIYPSSVGGANSNDYEVDSTLALTTAGGVYIQYLRASANAMPGVGSYVSVELQNPTFAANGACTATLALYQMAGGTLNSLGYTQIACHNRLAIKSVIFGPYVWVFVDNLPAASATVQASTGQPGVGGYSMPNGNGVWDWSLAQRVTNPPGMVDPTTVHHSSTPNTIRLQFAGSTDPNGPGVVQYVIYKNRTFFSVLNGASFEDETDLTPQKLSQAKTYHFSIEREKG